MSKIIVTVNGKKHHLASTTIKSTPEFWVMYYNATAVVIVDRLPPVGEAIVILRNAGYITQPTQRRMNLAFKILALPFYVRRVKGRMEVIFTAGVKLWRREFDAQGNVCFVYYGVSHG